MVILWLLMAVFGSKVEETIPEEARLTLGIQAHT